MRMIILYENGKNKFQPLDESEVLGLKQIVT
jgi:hypothetical protein